MKKHSDATLLHTAISKRDQFLIKSILNGNKNLFALLMKFYKQKVYSLGMSFFKNEHDTEDFVQDVFIKAYTKLDTFQNKSLFSTWLLRIAYTTALNSVNRRKEYLPITDENNIVAVEETPEEKELRKITQLAIREAISELPEKYAVCLDMYFSYDIPYAEISEITGFPLNTIKSHIFRAKQILKKKLEDIK